MRSLRAAVLVGTGMIAGTSTVDAFTPMARWGAASTIYIPSSSSSSPYLLVLGGKSDSTLSYTYSSASTLSSSSFTSFSSESDSNFLALELSSNFSTSDPAWIGLGDTTVPATVWGVLGASFVYGGDGGTTLAVQTGNDSLYTFSTPSSTSISVGTGPTFSQAAAGTNGQPIRTIYSAISTSADGLTSYITGGERDDGSGLGYPSAYMVLTSSSGSTEFTPLPDLPTDLCHHKTVLLANGTLITIGGYIPSTGAFLALTTAYSLDTTSTTAAWQTVTLRSGESATAPAGRRGHSAVLLNVPSETEVMASVQTVARRRSSGQLGGRATSGTYAETILVHGGISGSLLGGAPLSDMWTLDLSSSTPTWSSVSSASSTLVPSARLDAVAQPVGYQFLTFGGYGSSGPADSGLYVYNALTGAWADKFDDVGAEWTPEAIAAEGGVVTTGAAGSAVTASTGTAGSGSTHVMGPTQTGFPTGSATLGVISGTARKATSAISGASTVSGTDTATSTAAVENAATNNKTAIAVGTSLGLLAALGAGVILLVLVRRRRRQRRSTGRFAPYGGRKPGYKRNGEGAEGLIKEKDFAWETEDYLAFGGEKRMVSLHAASDYSGVMGTVGRPVAMARYSGDRDGEGSRRDMLEDEDRSYRRQTSGLGPDGEDDDTASILRCDGEDTEPRHTARPSELYRDDSGRRIAVAVPTREPSERSQSVDPFEDSYGAPVLDYAHGSDPNLLSLPVSANPGRSHSPASSVSSAQNASLGRIETARKVSLAQGTAAIIPIKRGPSMLQRLNIPSFFGAGGQASRRGFAPLGDERGFLDPSTPPALAPLGMPESMFDDFDESFRGPAGPSAWATAAGRDSTDVERRRAQLASDMARHGRSVSSVMTAKTADSEALDRYQRMNIVQRERTTSSGQETRSEDEPEEDDQDTTPRQRADAAYGRALPSRPVSPTRPRAIDAPRGPRPVSPTRHDPYNSHPSSPIRPSITAPAPVTPSRRHVKDIAASINRRGDSLDDYPVDMFVPSPLMASTAMLASRGSAGGSGSGMMSPTRRGGNGFGDAIASSGGGRAMGPRGPKKVYVYQERGELRIANE